MKIPLLVEDLNYERIFSEKLERFTSSYQEEMPSFETPVPIDPTFRVLSEVSMTELMLRARINAAGSAQLLRFSQDLDFIMFGMRREGETLEAFRERIRLNIHMASPAGPLEMYRSLALAAANQEAKSKDEFRIVDALAEIEGDKIVIHLQPNMKQSPDMAQVISKVTAFISQEHIKPAFDIFEVRAALPKKVNLVAEARLSRGKGVALLTTLQAAFRDTLTEVSRLAWPMPLSWAYSQLHVTGIDSISISTPISDITVNRNEYIVPGTIVIKQAAS
jgi:phage-related baseplate assembly protein